MNFDACAPYAAAAAAGGTLTFMVGGTGDSFARVEAVLTHMGKAVIHAGEIDAGQAAKILQITQEQLSAALRATFHLRF